MEKVIRQQVKRFANRFLFGFVLILFLVCFATLPLVIGSAATAIMYPPSEQVFHFTPEDESPKEEYTNLHIHIVALDEVNELAKLKVHGYRSCGQSCDNYEERVLFFNADKHNDHLEEAIPAYERVELPGSPKEFTTEVSVPMTGNLFYYPFDEYKVSIGVALERKFPDGNKVLLSPEETKGRLVIKMEDEIPRVNLFKIKDLDTKSIKPKKLESEYAYAKELKFQRPTYLVIVVILIMLLSIVVTAFTMFTRPFEQLIINTSALIFGVWSIRSLLLTGYPSDITLIDTLLQGMVVFILMTLAFRGMNYFHRNGHLHLFPWARASLTKDCPSCLTELKIDAKRCYACTATIDN